MKYIKNVFCISMIVIMLVGLCGCGSTFILKTGDEPSYVLQIGGNKVSLSDVKTIVLEYKDVYNQYYMEIESEMIWEETDENEVTYEEELIYNYVLDEVVILEVLQILASENNIVLTSEEEEKVLEAATAYMEQISDSVKEYCGATLEQAQSLMKKYVIADKTIDFLSKSQNWEISENEARAITVQIMELDSEISAKTALEQLEAGNSFQQVYMNLLGESPKDYTVMRGDLISLLEAQVYLLKSGEYTDILKYTDTETGKITYFIVYCANDYLQDLTQTNRLEIQNQKKIEYWLPIVEAKRNELKLYVDERQIQKEDFSCEGLDLEASFYKIYNQYFEK